MNKRKLKKALKRLRYLPKGKYFFLYISNKILHYYYKSIKTTKVAYPSTIMLELTNLCNLACTTCPREYEFGNAMAKGSMNKKMAKQIIDETWTYLDSIGLTGLGETFLYKEIHEIVDYIKQKNKGIIISVSTNAVIPNFIEKVENLLGKIDTIQVSIDGLNEVYDLIRKKSDFNLLDKNLRLLTDKAKNTGTDIMLNMVVTKENYHHMTLLLKYAKEVGIGFLEYSMFNLAAVTDIDESYYRFYQSDEFIKEFEKLEVEIAKTPEVIISDRNFLTENNFQKCPFPWSYYYFSWDGYIPPCCAKPFPKELNFGNIAQNRVIDTLNSDSYKEFRILWKKNITPDFCKKCNFVSNELQKRS